MKLIAIQGLFKINPASPSPIVFSTMEGTCICFYLIPEDGMALNTARIILKFRVCIEYTFGGPSGELVYGHPYYELGLDGSLFYELQDSDWIKACERINSIHPQHDPERWKKFKHYILTFHDNMFQCIAEGFEAIEGDQATYDAVMGVYQLKLGGY